MNTCKVCGNPVGLGETVCKICDDTCRCKWCEADNGKIGHYKPVPGEDKRKCIDCGHIAGDRRG